MKRKGTRIFALLLAAVLLLGGLPMQALAAEDEAGWFHLAADWNGELLIFGTTERDHADRMRHSSSSVIVSSSSRSSRSAS